MDVEIVLDMFNTVDSYDMAILVSGDGDFERALNLLRARGKRFIVVSTDEIGLKITKSNMILPCGVYGRWECNEENS